MISQHHRGRCRFEVLCHSLEEVECAAAFVGVEPVWHELVVRDVPGIDEPLYDIASSIDRYCLEMRRARASLRASHAFHHAHRGSMSGWDSASWKDGDDRYVDARLDAEKRAFQLVLVTMRLPLDTCVHYTLRFDEYLPLLRYELTTRDHQDGDIDFVIGLFQEQRLDEDEPVRLAKAISERVTGVLREAQLPMPRALCFTYALELIMSDLQALGRGRRLGVSTRSRATMD